MIAFSFFCHKYPFSYCLYLRFRIVLLQKNALSAGIVFLKLTQASLIVNLFLMADEFKDRLKLMRERRGWSQLELAQRSRLQPTAISHFETGGRSPSFDNLRRLADALNVSTDYLIGRSDDPVMAGPQTDSLFRDLDKLSDDDLKAMQMMKEALLKKTTDNPK